MKPLHWILGHSRRRAWGVLISGMLVTCVAFLALARYLHYSARADFDEAYAQAMQQYADDRAGVEALLGDRPTGINFEPWRTELKAWFALIADGGDEERAAAAFAKLRAQLRGAPMVVTAPSLESDTGPESTSHIVERKAVQAFFEALKGRLERPGDFGSMAEMAALLEALFTGAAWETQLALAMLPGTLDSFRFRHEAVELASFPVPDNGRAFIQFQETLGRIDVVHSIRRGWVARPYDAPETISRQAHEAAAQKENWLACTMGDHWVKGAERLRYGSDLRRAILRFDDAELLANAITAIETARPQDRYSAPDRLWIKRYLDVRTNIGWALQATLPTSAALPR